MRVKTENSFFGLLIFGLMSAGIGYFVAFHWGKEVLDNAKASEHWPSVEGKILSSRVVRPKGDDGASLYAASVGYAYRVDGQEYFSSRVWFGDGNQSSFSSGAKEVVARYPQGKVVRVHYNPAKPKLAVLEPGAFFSSYLIYGIGLLFFGIGLLVLLWAAFRILIVVGVLGGAAVLLLSRKRGGKAKRPPPPPQP